MPVYPLEIRYDFQGREAALYPAVIKQDDEFISVDCGYAGFMPLIDAAMRAYRLSLAQRTGIISTHH